MKSLKCLACMLALAFLLTALSACGRGNAAPSSVHEALSIVSLFPNMDGFIEKVHEKYPEISFEIIPYDGYNTTACKCFEASDAVKNGADEIDMVINIGWVKDGLYDNVLEEINAVKAACHGRLLKVIIETCLLTEEEKIRMCEIVSASDADFIKTSTGFSKGGATFDDIKLFAANVTDGTRIKAAGGISGLEDAEKFLTLGADRLGTSRVVKAIKGMEADGSY